MVLMKRLIPILAAAVVVGGLLLTFASGDTTTKPLYGTVVSVDAATGNIVIKTTGENSQQVTVATDSNTKIIVADKAAALGDIKAGMGIRVMPPTGTATEIRAFQPKAAPTSQPTSQPKPLYGTIVSVDVSTGNVVIKTAGENSQQVTVATDSNTKIIISDKPSTLANLKAGLMARVVPATGTATEIRAFVPKPSTKK